MAKTLFCDFMPLLDLHKKARRLPVSTDNGPSHSDGCIEEEAVLLYLHGLQGLYSLQALVPGLLRHEMELAMETLGLTYDKSYAWDIFTIARSPLRFTFPNSDLPRPFTYTTRAILVNWLIQVNEVFHFSEETLYLSAHLLNCCLHQIKVNTAKLQLLGVVCLFLAAKKEVSSPGVLSMPLEQACLSGREPLASSKNAKDRCNTATLLASRSTADTESNRRGSRCGSEKDSGYSDNNSCTDWLHADREDQGSSMSEPRGREGLQSQVKPEQAPLQENHILVPSPRSPDLTPIFIIKNVVLKQNGSDHHLQDQLNWENRGGSSNDSGPCHVILVQQPSEALASPTSPKPHRTQSWRSDSTAMKTKSRTYLPILKSYPRIAPHPSKKPSDKTPVDPYGKGTGREDQSQDQSQDKRMCTEDKRDEVSTTTHLPTPSRKHVRKQPDPKRSLSHWRSLDSSHSPSPRSRSSSTLSSFVSRSISSSDTTTASSYSSSGGSSPLSASRWPRRLGPGLSLFSAARDRRFLNTVGILSQSGLLDITLRTQDLLRQSNATDQDIAQLRQHTQLLYQAANHHNKNPYNNDPDNNAPNSNTANACWERIHQAMAQSGCYPSLKNLGSEEDHNSYSPEPGVGGDASFKRDSVGPNIATNTHNDVEAPAPPSPLLAPMSNLLQQYCPVSLSQHSPVSVTTSRSHSGHASAKPPETVTIMPPDSSTHGGLLRHLPKERQGTWPDCNPVTVSSLQLQ